MVLHIFPLKPKLTVKLIKCLLFNKIWCTDEQKCLKLSVTLNFFFFFFKRVYTRAITKSLV